MGSKTSARQVMADADVPVVPGTLEPVEDLEELAKLATDMGYPVMLKAAAGGGGKGMRRVDSASELEAAFTAAKSEAQKSFGDAEVYIEKLIVNPRHVEVQVLADAHGEVVHLFERIAAFNVAIKRCLKRRLVPCCPPKLERRWGQSRFRLLRPSPMKEQAPVSFYLRPTELSIFSR